MSEHKGDSKAPSAKRARVETKTESFSHQPDAMIDLITHFMSKVDLVRMNRTAKRFEALDVSTTKGLPWTVESKDQREQLKHPHRRQLERLIHQSFDALKRPPSGTKPDLRVVRQVYKQAIHERIQAGAPTLKDPLALVFERADDLFGNDEFHAPTGEYNFVLDDPQIFDPRLSQFLLPRFVQRPVLSFVGINSMLVRTDWSNDQILYMTRDWAFRWSALAVATVVHKPNTIAGKRARSFAHNFGRTTPESMAQMWERAGLDVQRKRRWSIDQWFAALDQWPEAVRMDASFFDVMEDRTNLRGLICAMILKYGGGEQTDTVALLLAQHGGRMTLANVIIRDLAEYTGAESKRISMALVPFLVSFVADRVWDKSTVFDTPSPNAPNLKAILHAIETSIRAMAGNQRNVEAGAMVAPGYSFPARIVVLELLRSRFIDALSRT